MIHINVVYVLYVVYLLIKMLVDDVLLLNIMPDVVIENIYYHQGF